MTEAVHLPVQASVVLLRICDFARRPVAEQARLNAQLDTVLSLLLPEIPVAARLVLSCNGSAAVAVLDNPAAALELAERALRALESGLGVCIGIDHGPVEVLSKDTGDELAGDGIATASVLAHSASAAGLLATQNFRTALAYRTPGAESALVEAVNLSDAGLRTYKTYTLDRAAERRRRRIFLIIAAVITLVLLSISMSLRLWMPDRPRPFAPEVVKPEPVVKPAPVERPAKAPKHGRFYPFFQ